MLEYTEYANKITLKNTKMNYDYKNLYLVEMRSDIGGALYYCGLTTRYLSTCDQEVQYRCASPGPMFDLKVHDLTDIVWINILDK